MQNIINVIVMLVVIVGALNWGLIALNNFDLVKAITPGNPDIERIIKGVVGLCGLYFIYIKYQWWLKTSNKAHTTTIQPTATIGSIVTQP
jgi:uncharacterized membrane protein YuzA (DUF378 family)